MSFSLQELESRRLLTVFVVTNTNDAGPGSLRQAVLDANATTAKDEIHFDIPGGGVKRINVTSGVYSSAPLVLDATTQPGYAGTPLIELIGPGAGAAAPPGGISFNDDGDSAGSVVRGFAIGGFNTAVLTSDAFTIEGCYIGMDAAGNPQPVKYGISQPVDTRGTMVGGTGPNAGNVFGNATNAAIYLLDGTVQGNWIGLNPAGKVAPVGTGIQAYSVQVGGTVAAARNVISGCTGAGITVTSDSGSATVQGNYIGTDPTGMTAIPNGVGISIYVGTIGGSIAEARNVIAGNLGAGIEAGVSDIRGNYIGVNAAGQPLGNGGPGVLINTFFRNSAALVGGVAPGEGNVIAHNGGGGVRVTARPSAASTAYPATIRGNSIYANAGLGIDLGGDGVTPNDVKDADVGPNRLQNFPVVAVAGAAGGKTAVSGSINTTPSTTVTLDFYASAPGESQGRTYLGSTTATTDANGNATFAATLAGAAAGQAVTATATDSLGNTSEISAAAVVRVGGDANGDGKANFDDLTVLAQAYNAPTTGGWAAADFNLDGRVDFGDLVVLAQNYNSSGLAPAAAPMTFADAFAKASAAPKLTASPVAPKSTNRPLLAAPPNRAVTPPKPVAKPLLARKK